MKKKLEIQDKIDRFLLNQMNDVEKTEFEQELKNNADLRETVDMQKLIVAEIKERESFMSILDKAEKTGLSDSGKGAIAAKIESGSKTPKTFHLDYRWAIAVAAVIIGIVFILWQPQKTSNQNLYNEYAMAVEKTIHTESTTTRGGVASFENLRPDENSKISEALNLFYRADYAPASKIFEEVLNPKEKNNELVLYMAISQLYANYNTKALANLIYLYNLNNFEFKDEAAYYLALAYIKTNKTLDARKVLHNLKNQDSEYADRAKQILSEMRWF